MLNLYIPVKDVTSAPHCFRGKRSYQAALECKSWEPHEPVVCPAIESLMWSMLSPEEQLFYIF